VLLELPIPNNLLNRYFSIVKVCFIILIGGLLGSSCTKEVYSTDNSIHLSYSKTKIQFDTVFTTRGSATMNFKIKNTSKSNIKISTVSLGYGTQSNFRFNINGKSGPILKDIELNGNDSIYGFVEVTVDPANGASPFVINDSLVIHYNNNTDYLRLEAWGQNAKYYRNVGISGTLSGDSPYVFVDYIQVPKGRTLTIPEGAKVYCHNGTVIDIYGTLICKGTKLKPIVIQGDRLERTYQNNPGQWEGIILRPSAVNIVLTHTIIKNGNYGILDSFTNDFSTLKTNLSKCIIKNMNSYGYLGLHSSMSMTNSLIYNCGRLCMVIGDGGNYQVINNTFDNSKSVFIRQDQTPTVSVQGYAYEYPYLSGTFIYFSLNLNFTNNIVYGNQVEELSIDYPSGVPPLDGKKMIFNCLFNSKIIPQYNNNILNKNPLYKDAAGEDYSILPNSPCKDKGDANTGNLDDINDKLRDSNPDIGAFEQ